MVDVKLGIGLRTNLSAQLPDGESSGALRFLGTMFSLLINMLLQLFLLTQVILWVSVSSVGGLCAGALKSVDRVLFQPAGDLLLQLADWIDWCLEPAVIVFDISKLITSRLFDFATRPVKFILLLWADFVDFCLQPFLYIGHLTVSAVHSALGALLSPLKRLEQLLPDPKAFVPVQLRRQFPEHPVQQLQDLKALLPFGIGSISPVEALDQLPGFGFLNNSKGEQGSDTMTSKLTTRPAGKALAKLGISKTDPLSTEHTTVEDYTSSIAAALCRSLFEYLQEEEGLRLAGKILEQNMRVAQELAVTEDARNAMRSVGYSGVLGAYDAADKKKNEVTSKLPAVVKKFLVPVLACYAALFCSGLLLSLLRFAVYGLH